MGKRTQILLLTEHPQRRQEWTEVLCKTADVWPPGDLPDSESVPIPEVVLTDRLPVGTPFRLMGPLMARGEIGVVAVTGGGAADVVLPIDATPREIKLACRLLGEVIRLRRRARHEDRRHKMLERLAHRDPLTGLANRRAWDRELANRCRAASRLNQPTCVAFLDLDHFKRVNQRFGHAAGDDLLKTVASRLAAGVRQGDFVARVGGDEFGIILSGVDGAVARDVVERIRRGMASSAGVPESLESVTASAGFALLLPGEDSDATRLFNQADQAMRSAKQMGRDRTAPDVLGSPTASSGGH